jgi:hypothetical protein
VDEAFFMGGVSKESVLAAFQPHIYFDDQEGHCRSAASVVSTARVPVPLIDPTTLVRAITVEDEAAGPSRAIPSGAS